MTSDAKRAAKQGERLATARPFQRGSAHELVGGTLHDLAVAALTALADTASAVPRRDDAEAIHDLRVALRRLRSVLRPVRVLYGKKALDHAEEKLRAALDLTSDLRDEEVLRDTLRDLSIGASSRTVLDPWMLGRARRERGMRGRTLSALRAAIAEPEGIVAAVTELQHRVDRGARRHIGAGPFVVNTIRDAVGVLEERAAEAAFEDPMAMHRVRISGKRLRYTAGLLGARPAPGTAPLEEARMSLAIIEKASTRIQKRLGELHDVDVALVRMRRAWGLEPAVRAEVLTSLASERKRQEALSSADLPIERNKIRTSQQELERVFPDALGSIEEATEDETG